LPVPVPVEPLGAVVVVELEHPVNANIAVSTISATAATLKRTSLMSSHLPVPAVSSVPTPRSSTCYRAQPSGRCPPCKSTGPRAGSLTTRGIRCIGSRGPSHRTPFGRVSSAAARRSCSCNRRAWGSWGTGNGWSSSCCPRRSSCSSRETSGHHCGYGRTHRPRNASGLHRYARFALGPHSTRAETDSDALFAGTY